MVYTAIMNVPGYLPWDDPATGFGTAAEAWAYLAEMREYQEDGQDSPEDSEYTRLPAEMRDMTCTGTIYGDTPGYDGSHDLGIAYSVEEEEEG